MVWNIIMDTNLFLIAVVFFIQTVASIPTTPDVILKLNERSKRETSAEKCTRIDKPLPPSMSTLGRQLAGAYVLKGFYPLVTGIVNTKEKSRRRSNMRQIRTETLEEINNTSVEQERKTTEKSLDVTETQSITTSSMMEFAAEIEMGVSVGASFFVTAEASMNFNIGQKETSEFSSTNTITKSVKFTMPSQNVRCPPRKKVEMSWNFFAYTDTIDYLVDYELDRDNSFFKPNSEFAYNLYHYVLGLEENAARTLSQRNQCMALASFDYTKPFAEASGDDVTLFQENGRLLLKNVPLQVRIDGHHGQFNTHEKDL
ncbi:hypothetical protein Bhyg_06908 [Pseudolycoriella hygida]|uniref:Uncharacterized protein n=1 Tax=Pseudolycoriella hygida TaxID=35572 RepID=A0A9Q0N1N2_9DIPT|nr:hypothetical protein Bhyg_06908 [Pseudolycoriella hygida]